MIPSFLLTLIVHGSAIAYIPDGSCILDDNFRRVHTITSGRPHGTVSQSSLYTIGKRTPPIYILLNSTIVVS